MVVFISVELVVISPLSFLLRLFDYSFFSFSLIWLVVYFVDLFKTSSWICWFFEGFLLLYLLQFCSNLSYFLSSARFWVFYILLLSFNLDNRVSILDLSLLLLCPYIAINFPLDTALNVSQRLWYVVSLFSLVSKNIFISAFISLFIQSTFTSQLFSFHEVVWFWGSFLTEF